MATGKFGFYKEKSIKKYLRIIFIQSADDVSIFSGSVYLTGMKLLKRLSKKIFLSVTFSNRFKSVIKNYKNIFSRA